MGKTKKKPYKIKGKKVKGKKRRPKPIVEPQVNTEAVNDTPIVTD